MRVLLLLLPLGLVVVAQGASLKGENSIGARLKREIGTGGDTLTVVLNGRREDGVFANFILQCADESEITFGTLLMLENLKVPSGDDVAYKDFIFCLLKRAGILTDNGKLRSDTDGIEKWIPKDEASEAIEKVQRVCGTQKGKTHRDTADLVYRCILDRDV